MFNNNNNNNHSSSSPVHSSSMFCELYAILDAVSLVCQRGVNAVVICDSKPALQSLSAARPTHLIVVQQILSF